MLHRTHTNTCRQMIKIVETKMATIFKMATNSIKNNFILMIIKTMLSAVIDTLCLIVIHIRINLYKFWWKNDQHSCNPKWPPFLVSIDEKAVTAFWLIFIYSTNFEKIQIFYIKYFSCKMNFSLITTLFLSKHDTLRQSCCNFSPTCITEGI